MLLKQTLAHAARLALLMVAITLTMGTLSAKKVEPQQAQKVAAQLLYGSSAQLSSTHSPRLVWDSSALPATRRMSISEPTFHVFEAEDGRGFVIVAADDVARPILAYSHTHSAASPHYMPQNLLAWLEQADRAIATARTANHPPHSEWTKPMTEGRSKLIETALWSQDDPYNRQCPMDGDTRSLTGCTATASAIVMYYYQWPEKGSGVAPAYTTPRGMNVESRDINNVYEWHAMLPSYKGDFTEQSANAVATLMADLGHVYQADYGALGTGALPNLDWLVNNFSYNPAIAYAFRDGHSAESWAGLMRLEIDAGRPIPYNGYNADNEAGHAFIVDGYNDEGYFHLNWGWGGSSNGYFLLENLTPEEQDFNYGQWILIGMEPYKGGDFSNWLNIISNITAVTEIEEGKPFELADVMLYNVTTRNFSGYLRAAHVDSNGDIKSWVSDEIAVKADGYNTAQTPYISGKITEPIRYKDKIRLYYRSKSSDKWHVVAPFQMGTYGWELELEPPMKSLAEGTSISYDRTTKCIVISHDYRVKVSVKYLGGALAGVSYDETTTTINSEALTDKKITIELELEDEKRNIDLTIKEL